LIQRPRTPTLFPYTTLFRSHSLDGISDTSPGAACLIICRFGVAPYPVLDPRFFILFMSVMHLGMEPAQFHDFIQGAGDRHGTTPRAAEKPLGVDKAQSLP